MFLNPNEKRLGYSVNVELYGLPADSFRGQKAYRVKAVNTNTFNVIYSDQSGFTFKKIIMPQLAVLKISVYDDQSKMIGHRVLPIVGLRPGYRYISLKNEANQPLLMTSLFVHIKLHDYVPEELEDFANALVNPISYVTSLSKKEEMLKTLTDENEVNTTHHLVKAYCKCMAPVMCKSIKNKIKKSKKNIHSISMHAKSKKEYTVQDFDFPIISI